MLHEVVSLFIGWLEWRNWQNRIEVGLLFAAIYVFVLYLKGTRGERIIKALGLVLVLVLVGLVQLVRLFSLPNIEFLLDAFISTLLLGMIVIFQPELRRGLIRMGSRNPFLAKDLAESDLIVRLVSTALRLSKTRVGALIVVARQTGLKTYIESGTRLDAQVSSALLRTLFYPGTALHDGAVIIEGGRVVAAGCLLPLSDNLEISKALGTRHRAAVGMTEESDAVVLVVSEETGAISVAVNGALQRELDKNALTEILTKLLLESPEAPSAEGLIAEGAA